ncbi:MAG: hypothetical protein H8D23_23300 [Candidatus Brocadiales bacterium]|nr:hypothetical protein [Candidatus Brocadiales bacterium]
MTDPDIKILLLDDDPASTEIIKMRQDRLKMKGKNGRREIEVRKSPARRKKRT